MNTILLIFANINILAVSHEIPKVIIYYYAKKYNTTMKTLLNYSYDLKLLIVSFNVLIAICTISSLVASVIGLVANKAFNDMLVQLAWGNLGMIIMLGSLLLTYGVLCIDDIGEKLPKRHIKI